MRLPTTLTSLLFLLISQLRYVSAGPLAPLKELKADVDWIRHIFDRQVPCGGTVCGMSSQYCCDSGSTCYTDANTIARCAVPTTGQRVNNGGWSYVTVTTVMTDLLTVVSTYSTFVGVPATTTQNLVVSTATCNANQQACGAICCDNGIDTCVVSGSCSPLGLATTTIASAPLRPTSGVTTTFTSQVPVTTTGTFIPPVSAAATSTGAIASTSGSSGLSGGAIAGIVIGVLAAIVLLILFCFCCIIKTGWDALLGLFGLRNRSRERTEVIEERYSRHGSVAASRRDEHASWVGGGGGRSSRVTEKKKSGFMGGEGGALAGIALGLAGLWALLGLRRREKARKARSEVSYETYSDSYSGTHTSDSSASSDRRTRDTRRTRETRESRRVTSRTR